jgi:adenylate kinase
MARTVFLGPPGAGKGTQAAELAKREGWAHLSTGDLLRQAVAAGTELGRRADGFMRQGLLVPDDLVLEILGERLRGPEASRGFVLDGYPRNVAQARTLEGLTPIDVVVHFELPGEKLIERLTQRRHCPTCGRIYNLATLPPKNSGRCDVDGTELAQRSDDRPEAVRTRLRAYAEQTAPLLDHYRAQGRLRTVDADGSPAEVAERLRRLLGLGAR